MTIFNQQNVVAWLKEQAINKRVDARIADKVSSKMIKLAEAMIYENAANYVGRMEPNEMVRLPNICPHCKEEIL